MVKVENHGIPKKVLEGRDPRYITVHRLYKALIIREYYRLLHNSFWIRGEGGTDAVAGKWKKLKKRTVQIKEGLADLLSTYKLAKDWYKYVEDASGRPSNERAATKGKLSKTLLSPEIAEIFEEEFSKVKSTAGRVTAAKRAFERIQKLQPEREFVSIINYRTGRLFASAYPGAVQNHRYYPSSKDQLVKYTKSRQVVISFDAIPYADDVDTHRKLMPDDPTMWIVMAHERIILEVKALYDSLRSRYEQRAIEAKTKNQRQRIARLKNRTGRRNPRRKTTRNRRSTNLGDTPF
jgi:hypothetical protein